MTVALAIGLLRVYQIVLSPFARGSCRYWPSCSHYAEQAIRRHGVLRGIPLAARRLVRCHPWGGHGFDPVP